MADEINEPRAVSAEQQVIHRLSKLTNERAALLRNYTDGQLLNLAEALQKNEIVQLLMSVQKEQAHRYRLMASDLRKAQVARSWDEF